MSKVAFCVILTFRAALDISCNDGLSLLQTLSHSAIPSEERNLQLKTIVLSKQTGTVFKTKRTPSRLMWMTRKTATSENLSLK